MARLEVITGPMFSGKSEELIRRLHRAMHAERNILVIRPKLDTRTSNEKIASRRKKSKQDEKFEEFESFPAYEISSTEEFIKLVKERKPDVLAIDEAQFFKMPNMPDLINELLDIYEKNDFDIIISGLEWDALERPFGIMPQIVLMADPRFVTTLSAICFKCKKRPANFTWLLPKYRKALESGNQILVDKNEDGEKMYEARCWVCHKLTE